jgi:hypothetical protein
VRAPESDETPCREQPVEIGHRTRRSDFGAIEGSERTMLAEWLDRIAVD